MCRIARQILMLVAAARQRHLVPSQQRSAFALRAQPDLDSLPLGLGVLRLARIHLERTRLVADVLHLIDCMRRDIQLRACPVSMRCMLIAL